MKALMMSLAAALLLAGCGQDTEESGSGTSTTAAPTTVTTEAEGDGVCAATEFDVTPPAGWWVHERDPEHRIPACALFHPEKLTIEYNTEELGIAIDLGVDGTWDEVKSVSEGAEVVSERPATIDDHEAIRYELRSREDTIYPAGTVSTVWVVNLDTLGLVAVTYDYGDLDYAENQEALDRMMETVRVPEAPRCSAEGSDPNVGPQQVPEPVVAKRKAVAAAAAACNYAELDRLAAPGFKSGFGEEPGSPSVFWRQAEASGEEPMRFLVGMLQRPVTLLRDAAPPSYVWPSAFTYEWDKVPDADREALRPLYDDEDFEGFADLGAYIGWRTTIDESGAWDYYVAGD
ncbi:MAG: hypothetical protein ACRDYV_03505 [Acidimicrobiia bacterium]